MISESYIDVNKHGINRLAFAKNPQKKGLILRPTFFNH